ncbi:Ubiquinone/menaquinone biosynthesis C-methylase UbiE [Filimonas lacunae]|uniref:Ubiquinone/menaquinone biosynthesis C-methylase UbiE n=1 Tax=Filimonas lacunae TaxID=477680 RepID=A0A173MNY0_9BACT|nr:class I SAM-dependent methyltransferase [Filimonas lacunae]BAV09344.1 methyltransferase [Filimonas lacunae]SIS71441.1 Ubiquinone/menaquinone biosynthesis C-methylase UbiE [Filimonas lacunae]
MTDILGQALQDYYHRQQIGKLWIRNKYGPKEEMPVEVYFRGEDSMPELELAALELCRGKVLDIGAGAGSHALYLQKKGLDVVALDISAGAAEVMRARGVQQVLQQDVFTLESANYDTLLLLMNGIGLAGTIDGLRRFLQHAKKLIAPGGQLLFDSSDIAYLYEGDIPASPYYGEIAYQYEYLKEKTDWFTWLYIDRDLLEKTGTEEGWKVELLFEDDYDQYIARLTL